MRPVFFRQSDVPEIFELAALLACVCPKGMANRAHAYKAAVSRNEEAGLEPDAAARRDCSRDRAAHESRLGDGTIVAPAEKAALETALRSGVGYGAVKEMVLAIVTELVAPLRERFRDYQESPDVVDEALDDGATQARDIAARVLARVKRSVGLGPRT